MSELDMNGSEFRWKHTWRRQVTAYVTGDEPPSPICDCCCAFSVGLFEELGSCSVSWSGLKGFWLVANGITPALVHWSLSIVPFTRRLGESWLYTRQTPSHRGVGFSLLYSVTLILKTSSIGSCSCQSNNSLLATPVGWLTLLYIIVLGA